MLQRYTIGAVTWSRNLSPTSFLTVRPYYLYTSVEQNVMGASTGLPFYLDVWSARQGLQANYTSQLNERHLLRAGGSYLRSNNNYYIYASVPGWGVYSTYHYQANVDTSQTALFVEDSDDGV